MKSVVRLGSVLLGCLAPAAAAANAVPPMPLETQLLRADLVAVGRLGAPTTCLMRGMRFPCAEISADAILKGMRVLGMRRYLLLHSGIMEQSVEGVQVPDSALFFLVRVPASNADGVEGDRELYRPVQGRRSILPLDNDNDAPRQATGSP